MLPIAFFAVSCLVFSTLEMDENIVFSRCIAIWTCSIWLFCADIEAMSLLYWPMPLVPAPASRFGPDDCPAPRVTEVPPTDAPPAPPEKPTMPVAAY
jgi:hypothetical protein